MTHYPTANESFIIAKAAQVNAQFVEMPNGFGGSIIFCGWCGRAVCHPECPRVTSAQESEISDA